MGRSSHGPGRPARATQSRWRSLRARAVSRFASRSGDPDAAAAAAASATAHRERQIADPALRAALTPSYAFGCTRVLLSDDFYPAVASDAVTLEPSALAAVRENNAFAINYLPKGREDLAREFGGSGTLKGADRFAAGEWGTMVTGAP